MKYYRQMIRILILTVSFALLADCSSVSQNGTADLSGLPDNYTQVALLLPLHGSYAGPGNAIKDGYLAGYYSELRQGQGNITVKVYDTSSTNDIRKLYAQAVADGAQMIIGPLIKSNVQTLVDQGNIKVPTISLNYVNGSPPQKLFEFGISPQNEATQAASRAATAGLSRVIIIAPNTGWASDMVNAFKTRWQQTGGTVTDQLTYTPNTDFRSAVRNLLQVTQGDSSTANNSPSASTAPRRQDFDSIFLVATPDAARQIVPMLKYYYAGNIPTYSTSMIYNGTQNQGYNRDLDGVVFDDVPWVFKSAADNAAQNNISHLWPSNYRSYVRLYALGLDAFNLTQNIKQLSDTPAFGISGATGKLYLGPNHWILQQYIWAQFKNGVAVRVS